MLQAMNTGHDGSLSTVHSNSARDALARIETMVLMAGYDLPMRAIRQQVASALDLIVHLERMTDGSRKVTSITEVEHMEGDVITTQDLFVYRFGAVTDGNSLIGGLQPTGLRPDVPGEAGAPRHPAAAVHAAERGYRRQRRARADQGRRPMTRWSVDRARARAAGRDGVRRAGGRRRAARPHRGAQPRVPAARLRADAPGRPGAPRGRAEGDRERHAGRRARDREPRRPVGSRARDRRKQEHGPQDRRRDGGRARLRRHAGGRHRSSGSSSSAATPVVALEPTTDAAAIDEALSEAPELPKGTRVYDAAASGVEMIKRAGVAAGSVIVLSDGADYKSAITRNELVRRCRRPRTCASSAWGCRREPSTRPRSSRSSTNGGELRRGRPARGPRRHLLAARGPAGARVPRVVPLAPAAGVRRRRRVQRGRHPRRRHRRVPGAGLPGPAGAAGPAADLVGERQPRRPRQWC